VRVVLISHIRAGRALAGRAGGLWGRRGLTSLGCDPCWYSRRQQTREEELRKCRGSCGFSYHRECIRRQTQDTWEWVDTASTCWCGCKEPQTDDDSADDADEDLTVEEQQAWAAITEQGVAQHIRRPIPQKPRAPLAPGAARNCT